MKKIILFSAILSLLIAPLAFAAPVNPPANLRLGDAGINGSTAQNSVFTIINRIANWLFAILITVAVVYVLLAAYQYLTSGGGEGVEQGHKMLKWAAVAIALAVLSRGFVTVVRILITNQAIPKA